MEIIDADITTLDVDAIVNGAIHRAAGPGLVKECRKIGCCPTGEARLTGGYDLPARHVIHTAGPVWQGAAAGEAVLLAACYRNCLALAGENGIQSIAFPSISTGVYGYPVAAAARIAVAAVAEYLEQLDGEMRVIFCCFGAESTGHHRTAMAAIHLVC